MAWAFGEFARLCAGVDRCDAAEGSKSGELLGTCASPLSAMRGRVATRTSLLTGTLCPGKRRTCTRTANYHGRLRGERLLGPSANHACLSPRHCKTRQQPAMPVSECARDSVNETVFMRLSARAASTQLSLFFRCWYNGKLNEPHAYKITG